jgi:O-acetyl-ADP-ribose deacetylase (regulator of RNase III)
VIEQARGNLLAADTEALVNTVNTVGVAGKGIALQFRQAFPENFKAYARAAKKGEVVPGRMFIYNTGRVTNPRYIINFPTKRHWKGKARLADIEPGLTALAKTIRQLDIKSVAVPPLGCGNGGLDWSDVEPLIINALKDLPTRVLLFAPEGAPPAEEMAVATKRPNMTATRAALLSLFDRYLMPEYRLTSLEAQKLAYFLQAAGQPMKLSFSKGRFGPYSETLNHVLQGIEGHFTRGYGDRSNVAQIRLLPGAEEAAEAALDEGDAATRERIARVTRLIQGFETPYGLELLATTHWATTTKEMTDHSEEAITQYVRNWTARKAELFTPSHIALALRQLREHGFIEDIEEAAGEP